MLKITSKATVGTLSPRTIGMYLVKTYIPMVVKNAQQTSINLDSFNQGLRVGPYTSVSHRKLNGHLSAGEVDPSTDFGYHYETVISEGDYYYQSHVWETARCEYSYADGATAYIVDTHVKRDFFPSVENPYQYYYHTVIGFRFMPGLPGWIQYYLPHSESSDAGHGFTTITSFDPVRIYDRYPAVTEGVVGVDLTKEYLESLSDHIRKVCDAEISKERQNFEAIHDTLVRESVEDIADFDEVNNIGNAIEILKAGYSIVTGSWSSLLSDLKKEKSLAKGIAKGTSSVWLKYRYQYTTTKSDVDAELERLKRELPDPQGLLIGRAGKTVGKIAYHATCIASNPDYTDCYDRVYQALGKLGIAPTWANIWDLVPFSFIVDWFVPFADFSEQLRLNDYIQSSSSRRLAFNAFCFSQKYIGAFDYENNELSGRIELSDYTRTASPYPEVSSEIAWFREGKSNLTWTKRLLDAASMWIGST